MAFTGVPVVKRISDSLIRVTGVSLDAGAVGTISLAAGAGQIKTPIDFQPTVYAGQGPGGNVTLQDSIELSHLPGVPITIVKTGTVKTDWLATLTNLHESNGGTAREAMFFGVTGEDGDYPGTVAAGAAVPFPQAGPSVGPGIVAGGVDQFVLPVAGVYRVAWAVNFTAASQLQAALGGVGIPNTISMSSAPVIEQDDEADQNNNTVLISATAGQLLSVINPGANSPLTVQGTQGGLGEEQRPSLVIELVLPAAPASTGELEIYIRHH